MVDNINSFIKNNKDIIKWLISFLLLLLFLLFVIFQYFFVNNINTYCNELEKEKLSFKTHINHTVLNNSLFLKGLDKKLDYNIFEFEDEFIDYIINEIEFIEENTIYESVYYIDLSKNALISNNLFTSTNQMYRYFENTEWYENSLKYRRAEISGVMIDFDRVHRIIAMSMPIVNNNEVTGFIVGKIRLKSLEANKLFNYNYKKNYIYTLTDSNNNTIYEYSDTGGVIKMNLLDIFIVNNFSQFDKSNFQHIYDGSTFTYWKYKISLNLEKIKFETINQIYYLLIVFGMTFLLIFALLGEFYKKYKKEILLDIRLNKKKQLSRLLRKFNNEDFYLYFVDIENLSTINQIYNYRFANTILVKFAADFNQFIYRNFLNKNNLVYLGGNDFVLILQLKTWDKARKFLDELLDRYSIKHFEHQNKKVKLKINYILYKFDRKKYEITQLEEQMNKISKLMRIFFKNETSNFLIYKDYHVINEIYKKHEKVKEFLLQIIDNEAIEPFFQPIINLKTGEIEEYEVLMRIIDNDIYLSPYPYIKVSEKYGLIKKIDFLIIQKTLDTLVALNWYPKISFNISSIELASRKHLINIIELIVNKNYDKNKIIFEITETNIIEDFDLIYKNIKFLKSNDFQISLDDFGTGFSNLETLKKLNTMCDYIKIDGIFIKNINENKEEQYIVKSIVNLAKAYKMKIVAEFIENERIKSILESLEVDYGQGYLFSKPKPIKQIFNEKTKR